jgi:mannose-6-phosphate isomerase-like protein (cupin superfamily)
MKAQEVFPIVLDAETVDRLPARRLRGMESTPSKLLWRSGDSVAGLMYVEPGGDLTLHRHRHAHHHAWVVDGHCHILGRTVGPGGYIHIPPGVDHDIVAAGPDGATIFYLYIDELAVQPDPW